MTHLNKIFLFSIFFILVCCINIVEANERYYVNSSLTGVNNQTESLILNRKYLNFNSDLKLIKYTESTISNEKASLYSSTQNKKIETQHFIDTLNIYEIEKMIRNKARVENMVINMTSYDYGVKPLSAEYLETSIGKEFIFSYLVDDWSYVGSYQQRKNYIIEDLRNGGRKNLINLLIQAESSLSFFYRDDKGKNYKITFSPNELVNF